MRQAFIKTVEELAVENKNLIFLTGDLGFTVLENFRALFPKRFFNLGVAESKMIGMAAGLALSGKVPIVYSIATFVSLRPYEFIRNDICYQNANVKIVGVGGGLGYGLAGLSHLNIEDLSVLRPLPNLTIISPADPIETAILTRQGINHLGPVYFRLGKAGEPELHSRPPRLTLGKGYVMSQGDQKVVIFATGGIMANVLKAAKILQSKQINPTIVNIHTLKPLDQPLILKLAAKSKLVVSVEEHSLIGGLGSAVSQVLAKAKINTQLMTLGIDKLYGRALGHQDYLRSYFGLSPRKIAAQIVKTLNS